MTAPSANHSPAASRSPAASHSPAPPASGPAAGTGNGFLSFVVRDQLFGLPLSVVQDVLNERPVTPIPQAPPAVAGILNLRGHIVTAIAVRQRLRLEPPAAGAPSMGIVVGYEGELFSLIVDAVGDVVWVGDDQYEDNPANLDGLWREFSAGVYRVDQRLMVLLHLPTLLRIDDRP